MILLGTAPTVAQQVSGTFGSPSATTTIDGRQLPPPDPKFGGVIKDSVFQSKPWWAPRVVPPRGAPNVLLIMTDDKYWQAATTLVLRPGNRLELQDIRGLIGRNSDCGSLP